MPTNPRRTIPRTFLKVTEETDLSTAFNPYQTILSKIDLTPAEALERMIETQERAVTNYTGEYILELFTHNYKAHKKKYEELADFYQRDIYPFDPVYLDESYTSTRTPDLTSSSSSSGTGTSDSERRQSRTTTNTPATTTTTEHLVNPYDDTGERLESKDISSDSGSSTAVESYSGQPDHVATSSSASSIVTQSGSDVLETDRKTIGRNGRRFLPSELVESGIEALDRLDILDIIINDIAEEIFLQVWIY